MTSLLPYPFWRPLTLAALVSAASLLFPTVCSAQDQTGSSLILDTERNRAPSEPRSVATSGGPTGDQAQSLLKQRIKEQSEGRITLFGFRLITVKPLDLELNGKPACAVVFEAGVEFDGPCEWASRYRGRPLTFVILKPDTDRRGTDDRQVFQVKAKGDRFTFQGYALFTPDPGGWALAGFGQSSRPVRDSVVPDATSARCLDQMKMIGLAFKTWALDHHDHFPFNVSTNAGGTKELCAPREDGHDANGVAHLQAMSQELGIPSLLVCPADPFKHPAESFQGLHSFNVSYLIRSGTNVDEAKPDEILARCPIHGHVLLSNGSVQKGQSGGSGVER